MASEITYCDIKPDTVDHCKHLMQDDFYQIMKNHVVAKDLRICMGSGDTELTIKLRDFLVGERLQKIDFKKLEQMIHESGKMFLEGGTYVPIGDLMPSRLADYILAVGEQPLCLVRCLEVQKTHVDDRVPIKYYAVNDLGDCCNGKLIYAQFTGNNNRVRLSGKNPSNFIKHVKQDITAR